MYVFVRDLVAEYPLYLIDDVDQTAYLLFVSAREKP